MLQQFSAGNIVVVVHKKLDDNVSNVAELLLQLVLVKEDEDRALGIFFGNFDEARLDAGGVERLRGRREALAEQYTIVSGKEAGYLTIVSEKTRPTFHFVSDFVLTPSPPSQFYPADRAAPRLLEGAARHPAAVQ